MNALVFDIETKNSFADVGGRENLKQLEASIVCAYSYADNKYYSFSEQEFVDFGEMARRAGLLVGFSSKRFDVPILEKYFSFNLAAVPHFDILEEIEKQLGRRIGLDILARANLSGTEGKTATGMDAIDFYKRGEMEKLKDYCLQDVKVTKDVFDLIRAQGYLWIPQRNTSQMIKLPIVYKETEPPAQSKLF